MKKKPAILILLGTRPEAIKLAPLVLALNAARIPARVCLSGQHPTMAKSMLAHFRISPDIEFEAPRQAGDLLQFSASLFENLRSVIRDQRPSFIVVQGDTTSAALAAMIGFYERIPVAHVEAGLRSGDFAQPFPEEFNRRAIALAATLHFCPTKLSRQNLIHEGISRKAIRVVGNTGIDALLWTIRQSPCQTPFSHGSRGVLVTAHRRENWDSGIANLCGVLRRLRDRFDDIEILFPVHPNPIVRDTVQERLGAMHRVRLIPPMDYAPFCWAMKSAGLIISDSGGVQEEALALGTPTLVTRSVTERPEVLAWKTVRLVGTSPTKIMREASALLSQRQKWAAAAKPHFPFGKGDAATKIVETLSPICSP